MRTAPLPAVLLAPLLAVLPAMLLLPACGSRDADAQGRPMHANVEQVELEITGMHCQSCVKAIKAGVLDLDGVEGCEVSLEEERGTVTLRNPAALEEVKETISRMGFGVSVKKQERRPAAP